MTITTVAAPAPQTPTAPQVPDSTQVDGISPRVLSVKAVAQPSANLVLRLSEAVAKGSVSSRTMKLRVATSGRTVPVTLRLRAGGHRLVVDPQMRLLPGTRYILTVSSRMRDLSGNRLDQATAPGAQAFVKRFRVD